MTVEPFHQLIFALSVGVTGGIAALLLAQAGLFVWKYLPRMKLPYLNVTVGAGDAYRQQHRAAGRQLASGLLALTVAGFATAVAWLLRPGQLPVNVPLWGWIGVAVVLVAIIGFAGYGLFRLWQRRRMLALEWAACRGVGATLERLCLGGFRVFHDVVIEQVRMDHVVIGEKGVFVVNTVARRLPKGDGKAGVLLQAGKLVFSNGITEPVPVGEAARNLSLVTAEVSRIAGHRIMVRSVLAIPGWQTRPDGEANHLVLNESNLVTLASWNNPDAFLMNEDLLNLERFLTQASSRIALDA